MKHLTGVFVLLTAVSCGDIEAALARRRDGGETATGGGTADRKSVV